MVAPNLPIPTERIPDFCRKWRITELSVFGSVLTDEFGPDSDVDVLVSFDSGAAWDFDHREQMALELEAMFRRPVDVVERKWVRNPFLRHSILTNRRIVYAA